MAEETTLTLETLRLYFLEVGGICTNHNLVGRFKSFLNHPVKKLENRNKMKEFVQLLASVENRDGVRVLVLKKRYFNQGCFNLLPHQQVIKDDAASQRKSISQVPIPDVFVPVDSPGGGLPPLPVAIPSSPRQQYTSDGSIREKKDDYQTATSSLRSSISLEQTNTPAYLERPSAPPPQSRVVASDEGTPPQPDKPSVPSASPPFLSKFDGSAVTPPRQPAGSSQQFSSTQPSIGSGQSARTPFDTLSVDRSRHLEQPSLGQPFVPPPDKPSVVRSDQSALTPSSVPPYRPSYDLPFVPPPDKPSVVLSGLSTATPLQKPSVVPSGQLSVERPSVPPPDKPSVVLSGLSTVTPLEKPSIVPSERRSYERPSIPPPGKPSVALSGLSAVTPLERLSAVPSDKVSISSQSQPADHLTPVFSEQPLDRLSSGPFTSQDSSYVGIPRDLATVDENTAMTPETKIPSGDQQQGSMSAKDMIKQFDEMEDKTEVIPHYGTSRRHKERLHSHIGGGAMESHEYDGTAISLTAIEKQWMLVSSSSDYQEMCKLLNSNSSLAHRRDFINGYNAMHWAAKHGNPEVIKLLNGYKVDADVRSFCGHTPLHLAAMSGNEECIELLVNLCKAKPNTRDFYGKRPKQYLQKMCSTRIQQMLLNNSRQGMTANNTTDVISTDDMNAFARTQSFSVKIMKNSMGVGRNFSGPARPLSSARDSVLEGLSYASSEDAVRSDMQHRKSRPAAEPMYHSVNPIPAVTLVDVDSGEMARSESAPDIYPESERSQTARPQKEAPPFSPYSNIREF